MLQGMREKDERVAMAVAVVRTGRDQGVCSLWRLGLDRVTKGGQSLSLENSLLPLYLIYDIRLLMRVSD